MKTVLSEIEKCVNLGLYQSALGMTLCIPDMCGALESENGYASRERYKKWFERNVNANVGLSSDDCYFFRCSFLDRLYNQVSHLLTFLYKCKNAMRICLY